ncbi:SAP domain-containing protein [Perilla frutescens var. hirtella]|nr:SAP domain-containing protein [Perilla frutescens var. hirtella]
MSSPYVKLGNRSLDQWKVTELKEELKKRRLTTSGLKQDLVRRLDEAVRFELESSMEDADNDAAQSDVPVEKENVDTDVSEKAKDPTDVEIDNVEKLDPNSGHAIDDCRDSSGEIKVVEADLVEGTKATGLDGEQAPEPSVVETTEVNVVETTEVNETVEHVKTSSESKSQNHGTNEDGDATALIVDDGHPQEDAKHELSGPNTQSPQINESSTPVVPLDGQNLHGSETQNEAIHSTDQRENDDSKCLQPDPSGQPLKHQVSEVDPNLGFQVTSDSVSTESVSIIEKNELKIDVINDDVKLELDVKPETVQQSPSGAVPDGGESHPMDVEEPLDNKDFKDNLDRKDAEEPRDIELHIEATGGSKVENVDSLKSFDSEDIGPPEKLSLDRSSGDDSMEDDVMESKQMDDKSDSFTENVEKSGTPSVKEEDHVDVVGHDKPVEVKVQPVETEVANAENEEVSTLTSGKRKFQDKEAVGNNDVAKKVRRWNAEGLKSSEPQSGSITPKGSSEPSFKPISGANNTANAEAPKERVVPPSSKLPTNSLRIDRFLRPFTLKAVQELLGKTGTVTNFWMDHIKTHCYVAYSSVEEAVETRNAVYNLQWPPNGGRLLVAEFVDPQEVKSRLEAPLASPATPSASTTPTQTPSAAQPSPRQQSLKQQIPPPLPPPPLSNPPHVRERLHPSPREPLPREQPLPARDRLNLPPPPPLPEKVDPPIVTLDDLFRKTKATPRIYYLPLSDELVAAKLKTQGKNVTQ